jgi:DNA mismatch repair protein MutS2
MPPSPSARRQQRDSEPPPPSGRKLIAAVPPPRPSSPLLPVVDLLSAEPVLALDAAGMEQTLVFAFASGVPTSVFDQHLEQRTLSPSSWDPSCFAGEVFLHELVRGCFRVTIDGSHYDLHDELIVKVLASPPKDQKTVRFRNGVLAELAGSEALRRDFERVYVALRKLRAQLEAVPVARRIEANRRRLDILGALRRAFEAMAEGFEGATSGLARIRSFGSLATSGEPFRKLCDLIEYDEHLATVEIGLTLGYDGRIRSTELIGARENRRNAFYRTPFGRFVTKVVLLLRGYRWSDEEVLARLIDGVFDGFARETVALFQLQTDMEVYLGALGFRDLSRSHGLEVSFARLAENDGPRSYEGLFNPLLLGHVSKVVPASLSTPRQDLSIVVTGPNSGGKTRLLQAVALTQILAQSGLFVPARSAELTVADGLFVSLIEQATADQTEGRLGMELLRIRSMFEKLHVGSMVIVDELCSGTNPSEGEEMFELVVTLLAELRPQAWITTHFLNLAARLEKKPPTKQLAFFQVGLDEAQWPTYQFVPGVAPTSLAHRTAARLGVTREELLLLVQRAKRGR